MILNRVSGSNASRVLAILVSMVTLALSVVAVPSASAQECTGTISASVEAESLPGGLWAAEGGCLTPDSFYQYEEGPVMAKVGYSTVTYADGHSGRVAAGILTLGNGLGLAIVGVEDSATGLVKWSAVLGDFNSEGDTVSVSGQGVALLPVERANISASMSGTGTDMAAVMHSADSTDRTPAATDGTPPADDRIASPTPTLPEVTPPAGSSVPDEQTGAGDGTSGSVGDDGSVVSDPPTDTPAATQEHQTTDPTTG